MTLAHGTDRLESARLVLRRIAPDDLPFFTRIHALPDVAQYLYLRRTLRGLRAVAVPCPKGLDRVPRAGIAS